MDLREPDTVSPRRSGANFFVPELQTGRRSLVRPQLDAVAYRYLRTGCLQGRSPSDAELRLAVGVCARSNRETRPARQPGAGSRNRQGSDNRRLPETFEEGFFAAPWIQLGS